MVLGGHIRPLDLDDPSALAQAYAVECEATSQVRPGWVPLGAAARIAAWRAANGWTRRLIGAFDGENLVGFAGSATAHETPDTSWVDVAVLPQHQHRGVGARLVEAAETASPAGARRFVARTYRATAAEIEGLADKFAKPLGYVVATTETVVELDLAVVDFPRHPVPAGYAVATYVNGVPGGLRTQVGVLKGSVDAEAPNGDLQWEPTPVSAREYQDEISLWRAQGRTAVESIALGPDGDVVAWTCLVVAADPVRPAQIEGTMVLTGHRGRRLGRAVKVASLLVARDKTGCRLVRTSSDDQNVWMRAINRDLGFVPVESEIILRKHRSAPDN